MDRERISATKASVAGATVVERSAVIATHLSEVVHQHAGELLCPARTCGRGLDALKANHPVVLEEMAAAGLSLGALQGVLRRLLDEGNPRARISSASSRRSPIRQRRLRTAIRSSKPPVSPLGPLISELHATNGIDPGDHARAHARAIAFHTAPGHRARPSAHEST